MLFVHQIIRLCSATKLMPMHRGQKRKMATDSEKLLALKAELELAVKNYQSHPIETMLENHVREKGHPNRRDPARGSENNFPRELWRNNTCFKYAKTTASFSRQAILRRPSRNCLASVMPMAIGSPLIKMTLGMEKQTIMDYRRRTQAEAEILWLRKTKHCPYAEKLHALGKTTSSKIKCDLSIGLPCAPFQPDHVLGRTTF